MRTGIARRWASEEAGGAAAHTAARTMLLPSREHWIDAVAGLGGASMGNGMCAPSHLFYVVLRLSNTAVCCRAHGRSV